MADDPRDLTLDLKQRRGTGSLGDLDRVHQDPDLVRPSPIVFCVT